MAPRNLIIHRMPIGDFGVVLLSLASIVFFIRYAAGADGVVTISIESQEDRTLYPPDVEQRSAVGRIE